MKKLFYAMLLFAFAGTMFSACSSDDDDSPKTGVVTCEVKNIGMFSATFEGKVIVPNPMGTDFELGFEISGNQNFPSDSTERCKVKSYNPEKYFTYTIDGTDSEQFYLKTCHTYYVRTYMINQMCQYYGQAKSFTTNSINVVTGEMNDSSFVIQSSSDYLPNNQHKAECGVCYGSNETPTIADYRIVSKEIDDKGNFKVELLTYGTIYYRAYVYIDGVVYYGDVKSKIREFKVEAIDLGLSVKWAACNVGATSPEEYGDYFAWGETTPKYKSYYDWDTYKWGYGQTSIIKYCTSSSDGKVDNKTSIEASDDAARANWGGSWRLPTSAEIDELLNTSNCTWKWTTQNGVNGYKVTSKKNGRSIFLPAAGYRNSSSLHNVGSSGCYWSSSLHTSYSVRAYDLYFSSDDFLRGYSARYHGRSVRPVCP